MKRRSTAVLRGMCRVHDAYMKMLGRVAGAAQRQQEYVIAIAVMVLSVSLLFQQQIDAAGFGWWSVSKYSWFTLAIAFAVIGSGPFAHGQGGGGAMRTSPASA